MAKKGEIDPKRFSPKNRPVVEALLRLGEATPPPRKGAMERGRERLLEAAKRLNEENQR